jgi:hypothetical protein
MTNKKQIYIVCYEPNSIPQTVDGAWSGALEAFESKEDAEAYVDQIKKESLEDDSDWSWLGRFEHDAEEDSDDTSTRGLRLAVEACHFNPAGARA